MRTIYHISIATPEQLRTELLAWLERQMAACATFTSTSRLARDRKYYEAQRAAYSDALDFWRNIRIDTPDAVEPRP